MKKIFICLLFVFLVVSPQVTNAQSSYYSDLRSQIERLLERIAILRGSLNTQDTQTTQEVQIAAATTQPNRIVVQGTGSEGRVHASDIRDAVERVAEGGTVILPAGGVAFREGDMIVLDKSITIKGAGIRKTYLRIPEGNGKENGTLYPLSGDPDDERVIFALDCDPNDRIEISGISFRGFNNRVDVTDIEDGDILKTHAGIYVERCEDFRIHHSEFAYFTIGIIADGAEGVIDHNEFYDNWKPSGVPARLGYGVLVRDTFEDQERSDPPEPELGTKHAVFVEDNVFKAKDYGHKHAISSGREGRYVFRYNDVLEGDKTVNSMHLVDAHGVRGVNGNGTRTYEIYKNTLKKSKTGPGIIIRGGNGVIWGNTFDVPVSSTNLSSSGIKKSHIVLMDDGVTLGFCDNIANNDIPGYPCKDQIRDLYIWDNENIRDNKGIQIERPKYSNYNYMPFIKPGRDFYLREKLGYTPYTYPHPLTQ